MSFLGDLVGSIGGDKAPAPPVKPPSRPTSTNPQLQNVSKSAPSASSAGPAPRPVYKGTAGLGSSQQTGNLKRKADEISSERPVKLSKPTFQTHSDRDGQKPARPNGADTTSPRPPKPSNGLPAQQTEQPATKPPTKPPSRGSYAEIMARAKEAQQSRAPSQIGMIKHQAKEKVKPSKLAERLKQEQEKNKPAPSAKPSKPGSNGKVDPRRRSASPVKKGEPNRPKQPQAPKPPLHAPAYKGTMGQASKKSRDELRRKKSGREDEYLATDEEDDDDEGYGYGRGGEEYYSDEESEDEDAGQMEGGIEALWAEEAAAERAAKAEDAKEAAIEARLKKEKLERKQKLAALAAKNRK